MFTFRLVKGMVAPNFLLDKKVGIKSSPNVKLEVFYKLCQGDKKL